jgi:predicted nucleic acid-binding protein
MELILDTNFVIAAEREAKRRMSGPAHTFLAAHTTDTFFITFTVAGELACGQSASSVSDWKWLCRPYALLPWSMEVSWRYGEAYRHLAQKGAMIGANDLWIAATALVHGLAVVTNNTGEFGRVPGLKVIGF